MSRFVRSYDEYVFGHGGDEANCLKARIEEVLKRAQSPEMSEKLEGKATDVITITAAIEGRDSRQVLNRDVKVKEGAAKIATFIRRELDSDPGPGFNGNLRCYFRVMGGGDEGRMGSFQRDIVLGDLPIDANGANGETFRILSPFLDKNREAMDANTRMVTASAGVFEQLGKGVALVVEILKGDRKVEPGNPILGFLGQALMAGGGAGVIPGGTQAGRFVQQLDNQIGMPTVIPDLSTRLGYRYNAAVPSAAATAPSSTPASSTSGSPKTDTPPTKINRADVERWAAENPAEAQAMVMNELRKRGMM